MRKKLLIANWKMNNGIEQGAKLIDEILNKETRRIVREKDLSVVFCVPYTSLFSVAQILSEVRARHFHLGAQNCHYEKSGAFTGEISLHMLNELCVKYVLIGHSERRAYFNETDETVNKKLTAVLNNYPGITPVLCVGETEAGHEKGAAQDIIKKQLHKAFENIGGARAKRAVIAYEPVWAIGTGKNADGAYAKKIAGFIREEIKALYSESVAEEISVLYGGSMNALNIGAYLSDGAIDGGLVGGASLKPKEFIEMINKMSESEL